MKRIALLVVAASLAMVPLVNSAAQSGGNGVQDDIGDTDEITFYGHVFGHTLDQPMPANVEAPIGEDNYGIGSVDWCTPAGSANNAPSVRPGETCDQNPNHKLALFSTAGLVDVETRSGFQAGGEYAQLHNERGQTKDIELDGSGSITATVYLSTDFHGWLVGAGDTNCPTPHPENVPCLYPYWGWDAGVNPNFVLEATLYSADLGSRTNASEAPPVREAIESGNAKVVAEGQWGPGQAMTGLPGSPNAQQFEIDLGTPQITTIPKS